MASPDQKLIARFLAGEPDAVGAIDDWIERAAFSYQRRLAHVWEDVLQSARLEITKLLQRGSFRGESSLKTYLWRVVNSTCLTFIRKELRIETVEFDAAFEAVDLAAVSPVDQVMQRETESIALRVWAEMSADCRDLWQLILKGMGYDEMSRLKQVASVTLRVRVLRCREKAVAVRKRYCESV